MEKSKVIGFRVDNSTYEQLRKRAIEKNVSVAQYCKHILKFEELIQGMTVEELAQHLIEIKEKLKYYDSQLRKLKQELKELRQEEKVLS